MKRIALFLFLLLFTVLILKPSFVLAQNELEINFFYSETCPHCIAEQDFLDKLQTKYPEIKISKYLVTDLKNQKLLKDLLKKHNAEEYFGVVPLNFVGEDFIPGFDNGKKIEASIEQQLNNQNPRPEDKNKINIPIIGEIDISKYSLLALSIILGTLDGFNVCSLGAIVLILGLVLALKSRKRILVFGGMYLLTTAIVYGAMIILWHQLFSVVSKYQRLMEILVGLLGFGGGVYFIKEFLRIKKQGTTCESSNHKLVSKFSSRVQNHIQESKGVIAIAISILLFAAIITIIEFPCSAAVPVIFAGILANHHLSVIVSSFYIALYLIFYLLDEILVFLIALFTMKLWLASPKFVKWITLIEAIVLFLLGLYYFLG